MIIVLGASGYVGGEFIRKFEWEGVACLALSRRDCNIYDESALAAAIKQAGGTFLINSAGFTGKPNVDACEYQKTECLLGNGVLPGVVAKACELAGIPWGHVSSGCIYTGEKADGSGFTEEDPPNFSFRQNNCSFYSGTKALGEECLADVPTCYVWRLRIPFNEFDSPRNYLTKVMRYQRLLDARNSLSHLGEFVDACVQCHTDRVPYGIYNLTNTGSVTTREVVQMLLAANVTQKSFDFFESEEEFMAIAAKTPRSNTVLDNSKALAAGLRLSDVQAAIDKALQHWTVAEPA